MSVVTEQRPQAARSIVVRATSHFNGRCRISNALQQSKAPSFQIGSRNLVKFGRTFSFFK